MVLLESKLVIQNQTRAQWRGVVGFHQSQFVNTAQKKKKNSINKMDVFFFFLVFVL